jgi:hypothetical protein
MALVYQAPRVTIGMNGDYEEEEKMIKSRIGD